MIIHKSSEIQIHGRALLDTPIHANPRYIPRHLFQVAIYSRVVSHRHRASSVQQKVEYKMQVNPKLKRRTLSGGDKSQVFMKSCMILTPRK